MSDAGFCVLQPDCDDGDVAGKEQESLVDNLSSLTEEVTSQKSDCSHYVKWTVHIALALSTGKDADVPEKNKLQNECSSTVLAKAHCAQSCYHIEYNLLSSDTEPVKVDIVLFGPVAKMYTKDDIKILRTWHKEDQIWICWTQTFNIKVSKNMLISLLNQKMKLQIWNTKDKLCSEARYDRLKVFRMPQDQPDDTADMCGGIKTMVNKLKSLCKKSFTNTHSSSDTLLNANTNMDSETVTTDACDLKDNHSIDGRTSVELSPMCYFAGETSVAEQFLIHSSGVSEILWNISLDKSLMSDQLKAELRPLVISIISATSMPSSPVPLHVLKEICMPVYCQYKFYNFNVQRTNRHKHAAKIYFRDVNVILCGLMSPQELQESLSGPPLQIEVHDRDRKEEKTPKTAVMFGTRLDGGMQSNRTPIKQKLMPFNYHGIASLNLSDLLHGKKTIQMDLPIKCCPPPLLLDKKRSAPNMNITDKMAHEEPVPPGHYTNANSQLKVKVELACPLDFKNDSCELKSYGGPFGCIIYVFDYNNFSVMTKLRSEILRINASAFHLSSCSLENLQQALSNYTLNFKHDESENLDFVTGFHVLDKKKQIVVLEGLKQKAVRRLWETVPMKLSRKEEEQVTVCYNSDLGFFKRIYETFDVGLTPIYLHKPLENIMKQPCVYIRGIVPQLCFQALSRLSQLSHVKQLRDAVQYNLFPRADMILSMINEYGTNVEQLEHTAKPNTEVEVPTLPVRMKRQALLDTHNTGYSEWKHNSQKKDFIQLNIEKMQQKSERLPKHAVLRIQQAEGTLTHNYSIQTLNSSEQAKEQLRKEMAKLPGRRFTYSQQYHSATVEPGHVTSSHDSKFAFRFWITSTSSDKSKVHPGLPDAARLEELRKPWRENVLHANTLRPLLSRDRWAWSQRNKDFQLYSKPPPSISSLPVTVHLAGGLLQQEQREAARTQPSHWLKKLPSRSNTNPTYGTNIEVKCYMEGNSDTLQHILKDDRKKNSLRKPGLLLKPIPQLTVMDLAPGNAVEKHEALAPGSCTNCCLSSKNTT